jgi:hypothetical protein
LEHALYGTETSTLQKIDQKYLESFEMWCWRRMEKISWTDRVRNEEVLERVKEERNILHTIKRRKADWVYHILRRNCLLKHVIVGKIEGRVEMTGRRGRGRKQLLDDLKETRGYWKLKAKALVALCGEFALEEATDLSWTDYEMKEHELFSQNTLNYGLHKPSSLITTGTTTWLVVLKRFPEKKIFYLYTLGLSDITSNSRIVAIFAIIAF